jgi:integral membrane protein (TIGR01906 family)
MLITARLLMTPLYLRLEYNRPGLPDDPFGLTREDRLRYGPLGLEYLFNDEDISFLGDLRFENGEPLFNERELSHMYDVKLVTQQLTRFGIGLLTVYALCSIALAASPATRPTLLRALLDGGMFTIVLIITGLITVVLAFDWLFTEFHRLFFTGETWIFPTSDTLIRLYPEQIWIDAFIFVFGGALVAAIAISALAWWALRRRRVSRGTSAA